MTTDSVLVSTRVDAWRPPTIVALTVGAIAVLTYTLIDLLLPLSQGGPFQSAADAWYTGAGSAIGLSGFVVAIGIHRLQHGADGRLGGIGAWVSGICCLALAVQTGASVAVGAELQWGPIYPIATLGSVGGLVLLVVGSWRSRILPRWMLAVWPPIWLVGSFFALGPIALLLAALFVAMAIALLRRRR